MSINRYCRKDDLTQDFKKSMGLIYLTPYRHLNYDALWKWSSLMTFIGENAVQNNLSNILDKKLLDVGGGYVATSFLMSEYMKVTNVDINYGGNWFKTEPGGVIEGLNYEFYNKDNLEFKEINFLTQSDQLNDEYYDYVIDGCSIIHFNPIAFIYMNEGLFSSSEIIHKKLKPGGYFFASSDLIHPHYKQKEPEWLTPEEFIYIVESAGFKLIGGDFDHTVDEHYSDLNNAFPCRGGTFHLLLGRFAFQKI